MQTIIENAEGADVTDAQAGEMERAGVIYRCPDPECCGMFHIATGKTWDDVDAVLTAIA
ncbi:hypothetical protein [Burkholderia vietnamiensis]|uniref:hypothetical protein n=1 Tax=Burkholderia vietnamiensis TaxID=60552 RepID=UPI001CF3E4EA|nr:hypothetical protein [Burkholderia vietnamiensis]MCA7945602.1 hypothetical protein [Burkholderia vietnamiensis]HDR9165784.1 hypothetical protein [Burkholderia vietnamiensis]